MRNGLMAAVLLCLVLGMGGAAAQGGSEFPVCTAAPSIQWMPAASGTRIVWVDQRSGTSNDIYMYDLERGRERAICIAPEDQMWPSIAGDRIVWRDKRSGLWEIYLYDLSTGIERRIDWAPTSDVQYVQGPDIDGDLIVWADDRDDPGGNHNVFAYDLSTETLLQITDEAAEQGRQGPRVHEGRIVWCDFRNGPDGDVYMYDLSTEAETLVAGGSISQSQPDIYGDIVVWTQAGASSFDIWYRDLTTPTPVALCEADYIQDHPKINGRWVVWSDDRNGEGDTTKDEVYAYDMAKGQARPLSASDGPYGNLGPAIAETGIVAWQDFRNGDRDAYTNSDIYAYILPRFPDVLATHWAYDAVEACAEAGVVSGYPDGTYQPDNAVTRGQMAVYIARALVAPSGEAALADYVPSDPRNFPDAPPTGYGDDGTEPYWAYTHIEYCVENGVVQGYLDGNYHPDEEVNRAQMAVYVARSLVAPSGEAGLADYAPADPRNFPDVPDTGYGDDGTEPYWAYRHVEYCVEHEVVQGYLDGLYHPDEVVTRAQMAVYVARAFGLAM